MTIEEVWKNNYNDLRDQHLKINTEMNFANNVLIGKIHHGHLIRTKATDLVEKILYEEK